MIRAKEPAYPVPLGAEEGLAAGMNPDGLTKREHFAAMAMQAILSQSPPFDVEHDEMGSFMEVASEYAAQAADALLAELEKTS